MPTVKNRYVSDYDYLGQLRRTFGGIAGGMSRMFRSKPAPPVKAAEPKKPTTMDILKQHNKEIRDISEGKY